MHRHAIAVMFALMLAPQLAFADDAVASGGGGNLLRNGDFQDDWITLLNENKNHHWCYSSEFFNRRDYNPDGWFCKGSWEWRDADARPGERRFVLHGPASQATQRVNLFAVHNDRAKTGFPDAGGFPQLEPLRSKTPERLVRDPILRVRLRGKDIPAKAGAVELALCPPGSIETGDPMGTVVPPTVAASVEIPEGSYADKTVEVKLTAAAWLAAAREAAAKDAKEQEEVNKSGLALPGTISVAIRYSGAAGELEILNASLEESDNSSPNLLANGSFEALGPRDYPTGWGPQQKYRYFPPGHYYIFNTWHNAGHDNRGPVEADALIAARGNRSLKMIVAAGDEKSVSSEPIVLNQKEPRLIEVSALVKTDHLQAMQIDAVDENGKRLDAFSFMNKSPVSIGTNDWRRVRQVFRPAAPVKSIRLMLCARGVNGYTLDDTANQPQNNVVGTIWWDDVRVSEPESTPAELAARGVEAVQDKPIQRGVHVEEVDLGERKLGENLLRVTFVNPTDQEQHGITLWFSWEGKDSAFMTKDFNLPPNSRTVHTLPYRLTKPALAYSQFEGRLEILGNEQVIRSAKPLNPWSQLWFGAWTEPINLQLGSLYLQPEQTRQFVRLNFGFSSATMAKLAAVKLEVVRRGTGKVVSTLDVLATPAAIAAQREKVPAEMRGDFSNLLLADVDVAMLPLQPFNDPQRNWFIRATALTADGGKIGTVDSQPFCRLLHDAPQPEIKKVHVDADPTAPGLYVNDQPWMPWGAVYGFVPVYSGPADPGPGKYRDFHNLPAWGIYDRFTAEPYNRRANDLNCMRYVAASITPIDRVTKLWADDNLYVSSAFNVPEPVYSLDEMNARGGGADKAAAYLTWCKSAPMVVSVAPGIEEAFGLFHSVTPEQIVGMGKVVEHIRAATGKPVMVSHGGGWNRFEFEKAPRFDVYDPETEPLYPAPIHSDLMPLLQGKAARLPGAGAVWLRPQMYEDVPFERWRFHVWVELMRGCRGWQIAHGPGDASLFRGLHGEMEFIKPVAYSKDRGPEVSVEPWVEHWSRRYNGKTYIIAATTRGLTMGKWKWSKEGESPPVPAGPQGRSRFTGWGWPASGQPGSTVKPVILSGIDPVRFTHSIQDLPASRTFPAGSKLVQWVRVSAETSPAPKNLVMLVKVDGRWTSAASWGSFDAAKLRDLPSAAWFLRAFYHNTSGFLGWGNDLVPKALDYVLGSSTNMGALPKAGEWIKLEIPLEKIAAADKLLSGVGFLHEGGQMWWGRTSIVAADGAETLVWGDSVGPPRDQLEKSRVSVAGLKAGAKVRVLFEDREITAGDGAFTDDFRGHDLYQRYGGYGDEPVALHVYEVE